MTTFLFFAELLTDTVNPNEATDNLYDGLVEESKTWYYVKWGEINENNG